MFHPAVQLMSSILIVYVFRRRRLEGNSQVSSERGIVVAAASLCAVGSRDSTRINAADFFVASIGHSGATGSVRGSLGGTFRRL